MKKIICIFLSVVLIFNAFALTGAAADNGISGNNWMQNIQGDQLITELNIPGTHDSATQFVQLSLFARCQSLSIPQQLEAGARFLDIRLQDTKDGFILVHGISDCRAGKSIFSGKLKIETVLEQCYAFLNDHPQETILFCIMEGDGSTGTALYTKFYDQYIAANAEQWYCENRIPTLDEVRQKLVLVRRCSIDSSRFTDENSGLNFTNWSEQHPETVSYQTFDMTGLNDGNSKGIVNVQDQYKLAVGTKWRKAVKPMLEAQLNNQEFNLNLMSTAYMIIPLFNACVVNSYFANYELQAGKYYGIVIFDFITPEMCQRIYATNF